MLVAKQHHLKWILVNNLHIMKNLNIQLSKKKMQYKIFNLWITQNNL